MACAGGMETIRITRAVWSDGTTMNLLYFKREMGTVTLVIDLSD